MRELGRSCVSILPQSFGGWPLDLLIPAIGNPKSSWYQFF
ncbi:hypothetical protein VDG1235_4826 [Verrucomicrobiia bacterium DG1235]|nr:hypothetical protein VDG1235_4826 [Verrucomicrobiae bacterium DG1235]